MSSRITRPGRKTRQAQKIERQRLGLRKLVSSRSMQVEKLEGRTLLAVGPRLAGISTNVGDLLTQATLADGQYDLADVGQISVLSSAPRELRFNFDEQQSFAAQNVTGIRITRAAGDGVLGTNDDVVVLQSNSAGFAGFVGADASPNSNVVVVRFPETLPDDLYRVEIFGADQPAAGIVGLRNTTGDLFQPADASSDRQTLDFNLSLGPQVVAVVPQPVERVGANLSQARNRIDVYFNNDNLYPTNVSTGSLAPKPDPSVVRTDLYQLVVTSETARNTDDLLFNPTSVEYRPGENRAILTFANDLDMLVDPGTGRTSGPGTFRLRVGTRELTPTNPFPETPRTIIASPTALYDFNTSGFVNVKFTGTADFGTAVTVSFVVDFLGAGAAPIVDVSGTSVRVRLNADGPTPTTVNDLIAAINGSAASSLVTLAIDPVTNVAGGAVVLGIAGATYATQRLGVGSSFDSATNLANLAEANNQSLIISSSIDPQSFDLTLPGTEGEPGQRVLPDEAGRGYAQYINSAFGEDTTSGVTTISYNFKTNYGFDPLGLPLANVISANQKQRVREAFELWSRYLGVQFVETPSSGITIATGDLLALNTNASNVRTGNSSVMRIDPTYQNSMMILSNNASWDDTFGQNYFQSAMTGIGYMLGLGSSPDLPASNEPVYPNPQDVLFGQLLHRPDSNDIDMYRFEVQLGEGQEGVFVAQTFAERQANASLLDTVLRLYREEPGAQATISTDFNTGGAAQLSFTANREGARGNELVVTFTKAPGTGLPQVVVVGSTINVYLDSAGATAQEVYDALRGNADAMALVSVSLSGDASTNVAAPVINYSPLSLAGGRDRTRQEIAQNDDYYSNDSQIRMNLPAGIYYLGVSAKGNDAYDPTIDDTGYGGRSQGDYKLQVVFRPLAAAQDTIRDQDRALEGLPGTPLDGDGDGTPGGVYNYWFQVQNVNRVLEFVGSGSAFNDGQVVTITNQQGVVRRFEFDIGNGVSSGNVPVLFSGASTPDSLATALANAINGSLGFNTPGFAVASGPRVTLMTLANMGDRSVSLSSGLVGLAVRGKTIFVDKMAGPNADGSLSRPFNNISSATVTNAFASARPGDIVRIVGNGGTDGNLQTVNDTFAYEIGFGTLPGQTLNDGTTMEVPKGVTVMVDAGAVFKLRSARIGVGSSSLGVDRSQGALQVLGTPNLSVYFTSWLDETIGRDTFLPTTAPAKGNWGGIAFRGDLDHAKGQFDYEDEGIFLNYVNHADIRYGGGVVSVDSVGQVVQPIQMLESRPTVTFNTISQSADSALAADPDSFEETDFSQPRYQLSGAFTPDYGRVGPEVHGNKLVDNSINGLFVKISTPAGNATKSLTVPGRFDDTDIVHYLAENLDVRGTPGGPILETVSPAVNLVSLTPIALGTLAAGNYTYRLTYVDSDGFESPPSAPTGSANLASTGGIRLGNLPTAPSGYVARRIYRQSGSDFVLVGQINASDLSYIDTGKTAGGLLDTSVTSLRRPRLDARLAVDAGTIVKLEGARIEVSFGGQLIAEGQSGNQVVFTASTDDRFGAGGTFDTNNDDSRGASEAVPTRGSWGGIYLGHTSSGNIDQARLAYGGGITKIEGTFTSFNVLEVHQADLRLANSVVEQNATGVGGQAPSNRLGRMDHTVATIFVRGAQPTIVDNVIRDNDRTAIDIDLNSLDGRIQADSGRQTGELGVVDPRGDNRGPLVRGNSLTNNGVGGSGLNAMRIRGGTLAVEGVWDDTDIVHVLAGSVTIPNFHSLGGLRLQSSPTESLVIKTLGATITAAGTPVDIQDRVGGTLHVIGQPGYPVVITSLYDDTVGAGLQPDRTPQTDTNNDGSETVAKAADWTGLKLDQYSNDRNVEILLETETSDVVAPGANATTATAQVLGDLAETRSGGDDNLRLGFKLLGYLNDARDVDVYSFTAAAGTEVWVDIDRSTQSLDAVLELLNADGDVLARSDDSSSESDDPTLLVASSGMRADHVLPLVPANSKDFWTLNPRDAGFRVVLPGTPGSRTTYHFRIRSDGDDLTRTDSGLTSGVYEVQLRMQQKDDVPGSTVRYADIRYTVNAVNVVGVPVHSPLTGEATEDEIVAASEGSPDNNDQFDQDLWVPGTKPQRLGNLLQQDRATLSVAGSISNLNDIDFYRFDVSLQNVATVGNPPLHVPTVFDLDYADGLTRPDTTVSVFQLVTDPFGQEFGQLVLIGRDSNIADDQPRPLSGADMTELLRGSAGTLDPFIGPVSLPNGGTYFAVVTRASQIPDELVSNPLVRLEPVNSVVRIAEDRIGSFGGSTAAAPVVPVLLDPTFVGTGSNLWHVTNRRAGDAGHGLTPAFDGSRVLGGGTVIDSEPNNSLAGSQNIDGAQWSLDFDADVGDATVNTSTTIPHIRINGTGDDSFDYYSFAVSAPGTFAIFDVDGASTGLPGTVDAALFLYDLAGNLLASNDNSSTSDGQTGSTSFQDPYLEHTFAAAGTYVIGVARTGSVGAPGGITGNPLPQGTEYTLHVSVDGHGLAPINVGGGQSFYFGNNFSGDYDTGGRSVGNLISNPFSLAGYSDADQPMLYFNYYLETDGFTDAFRVYARNAAGVDTLLASNRPGEAVGGVQRLVDGSGGWLQARLDLGAVAGQAGLRLRYEFDTVNGFANNFEGAYVDDVIIGFAERGEMVTNAGLNTDFTANPAAAGTSVAAGAYQLEIRGGESFGTSRSAAPNTLRLTDTFDTNDRLTTQTTIQIPAGAALGDALTFELGDGVNRLTFEFDDVALGNGVASGNVRVPFQSTDSSATVAAAVRDAVNGQAVQAVLKLQATSANGISSGALNDDRVALHGNAVVAPGGSGVGVRVFSFEGDSNLERDQGQILIQSNTIRDPKDFGIVADAGIRDTDPDVFGSPRLGTAHPGGAANLRNLNDSVPGGIAPGVTIVNNVIAGDMLGGVHFSGNIAPWELVTRRPARVDGSGNPVFPLQSVLNYTAGDSVCDGDSFILSSYNLTIEFEFEDIAGSPVSDTARVCPIGSGAANGNGWVNGRVPIFYRRSVGSTPGFTQMQMAAAIEQAIDNSVIVNNGTTLASSTTLAGSRSRGDDPARRGNGSLLPPIGPDPAVYVENIWWERGNPAVSSPRGSGLADATRIAPLGDGPQPFGRIVNNTIFGAEGNWGNFPDANVEPNDTIFDAIDTHQGRWHNAVTYNTTAAIGDNADFRADPSVDVDFYQVEMQRGDRLVVNMNDAGRFEGLLRLFDAKGEEILFSSTDALSFIAPDPGTYYVAVSGTGNRNYSPLSLGNRDGNASTGDYQLSIDVLSPRNWYIDVTGLWQAGVNFTISDLFGSTTVNVGATTMGGAIPSGPALFANNLAAAIAGRAGQAGLIGISTQVLGGGGQSYYVVVTGAANIVGIGGLNAGPGSNLHHLPLEQGILISEESTPTLLNNVLVNHRIGTNQTPNQDPYGKISPQTAIEAGSVFQFNSGGTTNVTSSGSDFNASIGPFGAGDPVEQLFVNAAGYDFTPSQPNRPNRVIKDSHLIDSAISSVQDRQQFYDEIKAPMGLPKSPILAPERDAYGQLRVDNPTYDSPLSQGDTVFKDRGAIDRADFVPPRAIIVAPQDNDALGVDRDETETIVQLSNGVYTRFIVLIRDGATADNPFPGSSIVDDTLLAAPVIDDENGRQVSLSGPAVVVYEDGRMLLEGFDYRYRYDSIGNTVQLEPLAGVWSNDKVYEIVLNTKDRFVIDAPTGAAVNDGQTFTITDDTGAKITFEYEAGYRLQVPDVLALQIPSIGTGAGGISDTQRFVINDGKQSVTFEFDNNGITSPTSFPVPFVVGQTVDQLGAVIVNAINQAVTNGQLSGLLPKYLGNGKVHVGATQSTTVGVTATNLTLNLAQFPTSVIVPPLGVGPPVNPGDPFIQDGQTFRISDGTNTYIFEFDSDTLVSGTNLAIPFLPTDNVDTLANNIALTINSTPLTLAAVNVGGGVVRFQTPSVTDTVDVSLSALTRTVHIGGVTDGEQLLLKEQALPQVIFEFDRDGVFVDANADLIPDNFVITLTAADSREDIADKIVAAILAKSPDLSPTHFGSGNIQVDDTTDGTPVLNYTLNGALAPSLTITGSPGVRPGTMIQLPVSLALTVTGPGVTLIDGALMTITDGVNTRTFEFDSDNVWTDVNMDFIPDNNLIPFTVADTVDTIGAIMATVIRGSGLGLLSRYTSNGLVILGGSPTVYSVDLDTADPFLDPSVNLDGLTDGDRFTIDDGTRAVTFEFEDATLGNGVSGLNTAIFFSPTDLADDAADAVVAIVRNSNLCTNDGVSCLSNATNAGLGAVELNDTGRHTTTVPIGSSLAIVGVPAGALTIPYRPDPSYSDAEIAESIIAAINLAHAQGKLTGVSASLRGGSTLFVDFDTSTGQQVDFTSSISTIDGIANFYLRAIQDNGGNALQTNRANGQTQFTILMPGVSLDYGDAPDPFSGPGRYATSQAADGARHTVSSTNPLYLGTWVDGDPNGAGNAQASGDDEDLSVDLVSSPGLTQNGPAGQQQIVVGDIGGGLANVVDANTFVIDDGNQAVTFEFDNDGAVTDGRIIIQFTSASTTDEIAQKIVAAIGRSSLKISAAQLSGGIVQLNSDDDDGVSFDGLLNEYLVTPINVTSSGDGYLDAWIDYNQDGDWDDPGEQIMTSVALTAGVNPLSFQAIPGAAPGATYARFRVSSTGGLLPTGLAVGGEIEDYLVEVIPGIPPVAADDPATSVAGQYETDEDTPLFIDAASGVLINDTDADSPWNTIVVSEVSGDPAGVGALVTLPSGATLLMLSDGSFIYDPSTSALLNSLPVGTVTQDVFTYRVSSPAADPFGGVQLPSNEATVTITLNGLNDAPSAQPDAYATDEDTPLVGGNVMTDDTGSGADEDADIGVGSPGTFDTLRLNAINGTALVDGADAIVTLPSGATLKMIYNVTTARFDGAFEYDPTTSTTLQALTQGGLPGVDSFKYTIVDSLGASSEGTVTLTIGGVNDAPVALPNDFNTDEDTALPTRNMVTAVDPTFGADFDPDAGETATLQVTQINGAAFTLNSVITLPSGARLTMTSTGGDFQYDPAGAFNSLRVGQSAFDTFVYTLTDIHGTSSDATVTVTIAGVNDAPTARPNSYGTDDNTILTGRNIIANNTGAGVDSDPDTGDVLSVSAINGVVVTGTSDRTITLPSGATLTLIYNSTLGAFDGAFTYDASTSTALNGLNVGQLSSDSFQYTIRDVAGATSVAVVSITVAGANDAPIATPNAYTTDEDTVLDSTTAAPAPNVITNPVADSDPDLGDTANLNVVAVNGVSGNVGQFITTAKGARVRILANGSLTYDPTTSTVFQALPVGATDTETVTYTISDNRGGSSTASVVITIQGRNDAPTARPNSYTTDDNTPITNKNVITDSPADTDPDTGETATLQVTAVVVNGNSFGTGVAVLTTKGSTVIVGANGTMSFDPTTSASLNALTVGQTSTDTFSYTISDGKGGTSTGVVSITVVGVNDPPVARNNSYATDENTALLGPTAKNVITNVDATAGVDSDADAGDRMTVTAINGVGTNVGQTITTARGALLRVASDGAMTYDPTQSATLNGLTTGDVVSETFTYTIADTRGATSTATVTVTVTGINDAPIAANDAATVNQDSSIVINILANDSDAEGPLTNATVTIVPGSGPTNGTIVVNPDKTVSYTPTAGYIGADSFQYTLTDSGGIASTAATVSITVRATPSPYQNQLNPLDVNADTFVSPIDALLGINFLNFNTTPNPTPPTAPPYLDVNGNRVVDPGDPLSVINFLNGQSGGESGLNAGLGGDLGGDFGEGEALVGVVLAGAAEWWQGSADLAGGTYLADHRWGVSTAEAMPTSFDAWRAANVRAAGLASVLADSEDDVLASDWMDRSGGDGDDEESLDSVWAAWSEGDDNLLIP